MRWKRSCPPGWRRLALVGAQRGTAPEIQSRVKLDHAGFDCRIAFGLPPGRPGAREVATTISATRF